MLQIIEVYQIQIQLGCCTFSEEKTNYRFVRLDGSAVEESHDVELIGLENLANDQFDQRILQQKI